MLFRACNKKKANKGLKFHLYCLVRKFRKLSWKLPSCTVLARFSSCEWHTVYGDRKELQLSNLDPAEVRGSSLTKIKYLYALIFLCQNIYMQVEYLHIILGTLLPTLFFNIRSFCSFRTVQQIILLGISKP